MPEREAFRAQALEKYNISDADTSELFDGITALAAQSCDKPIAMLCFTDRGTQRVVSRVGSLPLKSFKAKHFVSIP